LAVSENFGTLREKQNKTKMTLVDLQDELFMAQSILMTAPISQRTARQAEAGMSRCVGELNRIL
jgi:hypothetical protein